MTASLPDPATTIRELFECPNLDAPFHTAAGCGICSRTAPAVAALAVLEARLADTERALRALVDRVNRMDMKAADFGRLTEIADAQRVLAGSPAEEPTP